MLRSDPAKLMILLLVALGCAEETSPQAPAAPTLDIAAAPVMARLTAHQYENAIHDLLGEQIVVPANIEPDHEVHGFYSVGATETSISQRGVERFENATYAVLKQAIDDPELHEKLIPCRPTGTVDDACAKQAIAALARRAWRRPTLDEEIEPLIALARDAAEVLDSFDEGLVFGIAGVLQSPHFLFRTHFGEAHPSQSGRRYTNVEMASRLSFFLWNTIPDEALLVAAEAGELVEDEGLLLQAQRMVSEDKARHAARNFFSEYLGLHALDSLSKDPALFAHYSPDLGTSAREETLRNLDTLIFEEDGDWREFLTSGKTHIDRRLAAVYGVTAPQWDGFGLAALPEDGARKGFFGQVSFLASHAHPVSTSPTLRGLFVRDTLLCGEVPAPPANINTTLPEPSTDLVTLKARLAEHRSNPACAGCHGLMDPIGLGFERFDGLGRYRTHDNGEEIDPSGDLDGRVFANASDLGEHIRNHEDLIPCMVRHVYRYATGALESRAEKKMLEAVAAGFAFEGHHFKELLVDIVMSPGFRQLGEAP